MKNLKKYFSLAGGRKSGLSFCDFCYLRNYTACSSLADFML